MNQSQELFRYDGAESRSIHLTVADDGGLILEARDTGKTAAAEMFGEREQRSALTIPAQAIGRLAFALLAERLRGQPNAVDALRGFCRNQGITHEFTG